MPLDPLSLIAGVESSFGQNTVNPASSARGVWQDLTDTWREYSCAIGYCGTYATANDAPYSVQAAANAWGYNRYGFQPWSTNSVLMSQVAEHGGPSAFAAQGSLSTSPADYASLDTPNGLQQYFADHSAGSFIGSAPMGTAGPQNGTPNTSPTGKPFSFAYTLLVDGASHDINANIQKVQSLVHPWLAAALALSIMIAAIATMFGRLQFAGLVSHIVRASFVVAFVAPGSTFYANWVQATVIGLPAYFATAFGVQNAGPAGVFDDAYQTLWVMTETVFSSTPMSWRGAGIIIVAGFAFMFGVAALAVMFIPYLLANFLLLLMLILGPLAIVSALFRLLDRWLVGYVDVIATLAVIVLAVDVVIAMFQGVIIRMLESFVSTGTPDKDMPALVGTVVVLAAMAMSVKYLPPLIARITGGVGMAIDSTAVFVTAAATRAAARFARS